MSDELMVESILKRYKKSLYLGEEKLARELIRIGIAQGRKEARGEFTEQDREEMVRKLLAIGVSPDITAQCAKCPVERVLTFVN